jgi:hypothetical protein
MYYSLAFLSMLCPMVVVVWYDKKLLFRQAAAGAGAFVTRDAILAFRAWWSYQGYSPTIQ